MFARFIFIVSASFLMPLSVHAQLTDAEKLQCMADECADETNQLQHCAAEFSRCVAGKGNCDELQFICSGLEAELMTCSQICE
jgi:hypothetical protein